MIKIEDKINYYVDDNIWNVIIEKTFQSFIETSIYNSVFESVGFSIDDQLKEDFNV